MNKSSFSTSRNDRLAVLCIVGFMAFSSAAFAGNISLERSGSLYVLNAEKTTIKQVFQYVEKQLGYVFVYDQAVKNRLNESVTVSLTGSDLQSILSELCRATGMSYSLNGKQVVITNGDKKKAPAAPMDSGRPTRKVKGTVSDSNGEPLIGATVKVKGMTIGVVTDLDGNYTIDCPEGGTLEVSYIGFGTKEVKVRQGVVTYDIAMAEDNNNLNEVVVIGYGTVKKKDLTGAVSAVKGEDLVAKHSTQLSNALQGSLSGVMVRRNNGAPGSGASSIHVRGVTTMGDSSPLVIVDGVEGSLDYVNSNDVESITVLKDAAAASIYGSKAAAGVILITTKRASDTDKISLKYSGEFGLEIPTTQPSMVGVTRYLEMNNELQYNDNPSGGFFQVYTADQTKNWMRYNQTDPNNYPVTDWKDLILKSSAPRTTHNVTITGGNKAVRSVVTLSYDDVKGLYDGRSFKRYMLRSNNDFTFNKWLSASVDFSLRHALSENTVYDPFNDMRKMPAIYPAMWDDGRMASGKSGANPYGLLKEGGTTKNSSTQISGKGSITIKPTEGLSIQAVVSPFLNYSKGKSFKYACGYTLADDPNTFGGYFDAGSLYATNKLTETRNDSWHVTTQVIANYMREFGQHSMTLMAGYENYISGSENLSAARDQYELTGYPYLNIGPEDYKDNSGTGSEYVSNSVFGRLIYSYANRYLFQANIRHDGSSRFAKKYRWATFPSFSAGWVASEEKFLKPVFSEKSPLSYLKLRASWGKLGNERIGSNYFPYLALINFGNSYFYTADGSVQSAKTARPAVLPVEDITWETTTSTDLGLDAHFFDGRLRLTFDYYWKKTTDMLLAIQIPYSMGYNDPNTNAGKMSTKGWDIDLTWQDRIKDFRYSITVNLSDFKSKIDYLNNSDIISGGKVKREGVLFNEWYGYICDGIYQTQDEVNNSARTSTTVTVGDLKYRDISGPDGVPDGKISPEYDRVPLGNSLPRYQYGAQINAGWRGIDFSMAIQGVGKQNSYIEVAMVQPLRDNYGNTPAIIEGDYWSPFNTAEANASVFYPRLSSVSKSNNYATSDHWLFNGYYFRLKNLSIGYTLPQTWLRSLSVEKLRLYASASDLFCISNFPKGWDPEMGVSSYPITTSLVFGLQINF